MDEYIDTNKIFRISDEVLSEMRKHSMLATRMDNGIYPFDTGIRGHPFYSQIKITKDGAYTSFLDLGCGAGTVERQLILAGMKKDNVLGMDINPRRFRLGYRIYRDEDIMEGNFILGDVLSPDPNLINSFDYAYSSYLINVLGNNDNVIRFLGTAFDVLKDEGTFFGRLPENGNKFDITAHDLTDYLRETGFDFVYTEERNHNGKNIVYFQADKLKQG